MTPTRMPSSFNIFNAICHISVDIASGPDFSSDEDEDEVEFIEFKRSLRRMDILMWCDIDIAAIDNIVLVCEYILN